MQVGHTEVKIVMTRMSLLRGNFQGVPAQTSVWAKSVFFGF